MKRDIELQKPVAHSSIRLGKRVSDFILKKMFIQKAKRSEERRVGKECGVMCRHQ